MLNDLAEAIRRWTEKKIQCRKCPMDSSHHRCRKFSQGVQTAQAVLFSVPFGGSRCTETYSSTTSQPRSRTQGESIRSQLSCVFGLWLGSAVFPCYGSENAAVTFFAKTSMASTNRSAFCKSKMAGFRGNTVADSRSPAPSAYCPSLPKHHVV